MKYAIWCEGTSSRSWLKKDGEDWVFDTLGEAEKLADQLRVNLIHHPERSADFSYTVKEWRAS